MTLTISKLKLEVESNRPLLDSEREALVAALKPLRELSDIDVHIKRPSWFSAIRERIQKFAKA